MARATRINRSELTKLEIMRHATRCFLEDGYSNTSVKAISKALNMSPGNLTFHYPTKEHMLAEVVAQLCEFQEKILEYEAQKGYDPATVIGFELMTVATACADSEIARDFFISTFQSELCRSYLFRSHVARAKEIFAPQCPDWTDQQFQEAEVLVMGLQYATVIPIDTQIALESRVSGALNQILSIYHVDSQTCQREIEAVLAMDYRGMGRRVLAEFIKYAEKTREQALVELLTG